VTVAVAVAASHLKCSQNLRPAAGQLVCELACGQTAAANYLGVKSKLISSVTRLICPLLKMGIYNSNSNGHKRQ